jgi:hypothetical protein
MKKLLIFVLVVGMASMANAVLQISVDDFNNPDVPLKLAAGTHTLGIWTTTDISAGVGEVYYTLFGLNTLDIHGGVTCFPTEPGLLIYDDAYGTGIQVGAGNNGVFGYVSTTGVVATFPANSRLFDGINLTYSGEEIAFYLYEIDGDTGELITLLDSVQPPEPATITLLGLGGLLMRRRK